MTEPLFFDIESHSATKLFDMPPEEFVRIFQYAHGRGGEVKLTTDLDEMRELITTAPLVIGHNIFDFDLPAVFGPGSLVPLQMASEHRVLDTMIWASLVHQAPYSYTDRNGHTYFDAAAPKTARKWYSLDNQAFQMGLPGKIGDLQALAKKYNPPKTRVADLDYSLIPLDDPEFLEYAVQDVVVTQGIGKRLIEMTNKQKFPWDYVWREMHIAAITSRITSNGMNIDRPVAEARVASLNAEKEELMALLVEKYDFPTEGKQPWRSKPGKEAIFRILADVGVTEKTRPNWTRTATDNLSLGGDVLIELTEGTDAEDTGRALATLMGQRSLSSLALDSVHSDGFAHPDITPFQRSRRWSLTKPGVTVWTARGDNAIEKEYFIAKPGRKLVAFDYSNADQRILAAYSGDPLYALRFKLDADGNEPDGHELNGRAAFGDLYETDPKHYRQLAKILGHGWGYGGRAKTLSKQTGAALEDAYQFVDSMDKTFAWLVSWQNDTRREAELTGYVENDWGGRLKVDAGREFTQAPALIGQNGTREIMADALIRLAEYDERLVQWAIAIIHDELLFDIPDPELGWAIPKIKELMETTFHPTKHNYGQPIEFRVSHGEPANNWYLAGH